MAENQEAGIRIRAARLQQGLSQEELARKLNVSQVTISNWERTGSLPEDKVERLEAILGTIARPETEQISVISGKSTAFGAWLRRARESAGLSVPELAVRASMSTVAIYNLESGVSQNPQKRTREKLEAALTTQVPAEVTKEAESEQTIEGLGSLQDFDPHNKDEWPKCAGVYVFYDVSDRPIYVGQGKKISTRVADHEEKFWFKYPIVSHAAFIEIPGDDLRVQVEQVLIRFLKSNAVINIKSVDRE